MNISAVYFSKLNKYEGFKSRHFALNRSKYKSCNILLEKNIKFSIWLRVSKYVFFRLGNAKPNRKSQLL